MIVSLDDLKKYSEFKNQDELMLVDKLNAIEFLIRKYTNNNFQNRSIRFTGNSENNKIYGYHPFLKVDDTIQISESDVNDGLYTIKSIQDDSITLNKELYKIKNNLVTKIEYPSDVKYGVINLMKYDVSMRDKVGIKSESLSRYSVTYYDMNNENQSMGYPISLLGFLKPYKKARF